MLSCCLAAPPPSLGKSENVGLVVTTSAPHADRDVDDLVEIHTVPQGAAGYCEQMGS